MPTTQKRRTWTQDEVLAETRAFLARHGIEGRMPTRRELLTLDPVPRHDLFMAMHRHGGVPRIAQALGVPVPTRWTSNPLLHSSDVLVREIQQFARTQGFTRMPRIEEMRAAGRSDLFNAVKRAGGLHHLSKRCGLPWVHVRSEEAAH